MDKKYYLGIDCGSVSLKVAVMDEAKHVIYQDYQRTHGEPLKQLNIICEQMFANEALKQIEEFQGIYTTGSGRFIIAELLGGDPVNEITTHGMAGAFFYPDAKTIIEIGGQDSKLILLDKLCNGETVIIDSQMNDICAAGTGSFLDQQAYRLGLSVEALSEKACLSGNPAKISGRCSVFAKTDLIHLQQNGTSVTDLAAGLCTAVVRTYLENLVKGREIRRPLLFQGGVAQNAAVRKAFGELLQLKEDEMIVPPNFAVMGAIGSVLYGLKKRLGSAVTRGELLQKLAAGSLVPEVNSALPLLSEENILESRYSLADVSGLPTLNVYLGIDVGSVSAKMVAVDDANQIIFKHYTMTEGDPIKAVEECFNAFQQRFTQEVNVRGVGVTGSGRDYIGNYLKADVLKNEITAQAQGTLVIFPEVNTIIEIGGQDAKYIRVENGVVTDFVMNKTCAAGTGSFLAEQADRLQVDLGRFTEKAFAAKMPLDMGTRCTVFMETDCIHYQQRGQSKENILAGLSYSIAKNYLEKVVGNRPVNGKIVIQGGIAFNKSVVSAFGNILGQRMTIMPHHEVSGALGMAMLTAHEMKLSGRKSQFIGFHIQDRIREKKIIACKDCSNLCSLISIQYNDGSRSLHGGICGKYEAHQSLAIRDLKDYFEERRKLLLVLDQKTENGKGKIGIPQVLLFHELFPMWAVFFKTLGYDVVLSRPMSRMVYEKGISKVLVDTCFPIRCIYGAVLDLVEQGVDKVFLPYVLNMKDDAYPTKHAHNCQYVQQATDFIKASIDIEVLTHTVRLKDHEKQIEKAFIELAGELGAAVFEGKFAYQQALRVLNGFQKECKKLGERALSDLRRFGKTFVLIGHTYIVHDTFYNLNLAKHLKNRGIPSIPADILPLEQSYDQAKNIDLTWKSNNRAVNALDFIQYYNRTHSNQLIPVILTQFGCAADSMLTPYLKNIMGIQPWLELEVDEHNSIIGLITRCEAFWESIAGPTLENKAFQDVQKLFSMDISLKQIKKEDRKIYIFSMCEGFSAMPEVFAKYHIKAEMTEPTSVYSNNLGRRHSNEKHCRTYQVVIGDYLKITEKTDFVPEKSVLFMIGYDEACRASLFKSLCPKVISESKAGEIKMFGVTVDDPIAWIKGFGLQMALDMWNAIIMVDYLDRYRFQLRPYEKEKASVNRAYAQSKVLLLEGVRTGKAFQSFRAALKMMKKVPTVKRDLVFIGVVGDAFTRVHEYGMGEIFEIVEEMGGVVMLPPSWHDFINYGAERRVGDLWKKGKYGQSLAALVGSKSLDLFKQAIQNIATAYSGMFDEPDNAGLTKLADKYVNVQVAPVIPSMFIGKTVDFAREKNMHGLINSYGFNCSLGKVTTACIHRIRQDNQEIPMCTFIDDGLQQTNIRTRVEAFMEQAWEYKRKIENVNVGGYHG